MASVIYNSFFVDRDKGLIDLDLNTLKVMLVTSAYTPNIDTHTKRSDVTNEVVGAGYVTGGNTLANTTVTQDNVNNKSVFDADDTNWTTSTITARGAILYKSTGLNTTDNLICYFDFVTDKISSAGNFTITWDALGIFDTAQV